jgi:transposase
MDRQEKQESKKVVAELMQAGYSWQDATERAGLSMGRSAAYSVWKKYREKGMDGLEDGRHGHCYKVTEAVLELMEAACQQDVSISSSKLQEMLQEQMRVNLSITHINETRAAHGWTNQTGERQKKQEKLKRAGKREQEGSYS